MLVNVASNVLVSGKGGSRFGNGHPSIVPYTTYRAADAMMALAVGNDAQFARTAEVLGHPEWAAIPASRPIAPVSRTAPRSMD